MFLEYKNVTTFLTNFRGFNEMVHKIFIDFFQPFQRQIGLKTLDCEQNLGYKKLC